MEKFISFDIWSTLIKSHPEFKKNRDIYFYKNFNRTNKSLFDDISPRIRENEKYYDMVGETTGAAVSPRIHLVSILKEFNYPIEKMTEKDYEEIEMMLMDLALRYPPQFYDENTERTLAWLVENGYSLCTASNTGLLSHKTMQLVLHCIGIEDWVDHQVYSDEVGFSKPNKNFFNNVGMKFGSMDFLHVGDNPKADGGFHNSFIINSNNRTILDLKKHIYEHSNTNLKELRCESL